MLICALVAQGFLMLYHACARTPKIMRDSCLAGNDPEVKIVPSFNMIRGERELGGAANRILILNVK